MKAKKQARNMIPGIARLLRAAGEPRRLEILCIIFNGEKVCVSDIARRLGQSVAVVSHHLQVMEKEGLLKANREGKCTYYAFADRGFAGDLKALICKHTHN